MPHRKKWITVILCSLALLVAFSILSPKSVHAASRVSSTHLTHLMFASEGPPGCNAIQLGDYTTNVKYAGSGISVENTLLGWYTLAGDERYHFCDQILCVASVNYNGGKAVPAGILGVYCGPNGSNIPVTKRSNPTTGGDGITNEATVIPGFVTSCARYWIGSLKGPDFDTGGGCVAGQELREVPATL